MDWTVIFQEIITGGAHIVLLVPAIIIPFANDGTLTKRDLVIVLVFLGICHGVIEDTVIFTALGANWWVLISCRFILAALAAFAVSFVVPVRPDAVKTN